METRFYQVGGSVRDELLGVKSKDIDYAVEADSFEAMRQAILDGGAEIFLETPKFFTIRAKDPKRGVCDFVLCRKDGAYSDGRHPEQVAAGTLYDDLARRDFTMNAIAKDEDGKLIDPFNGVNAIKEGTIRCVGAPSDRFTEDGLRMLRAIRFSVTKGMRLEQKICDCLQTADFYHTRLRGVSVERVREELHKALAHDTLETIYTFNVFQGLFRHLFRLYPELWLRPTLEAR